jgi:hypothetical protein
LKRTAPDNPSLKQAHVALIDSPDFDANIERIMVKPIAQRPTPIRTVRCLIAPQAQAEKDFVSSQICLQGI